MRDTIYRDDAIDALDCINGTEEVLRSLPSAQPERKTGHWIYDTVPSEKSVTGFFYMHSAQCSECGTYVEVASNYCPHCGSYNGGGV